MDGQALKALFEATANDPHHDLKGIVILRDGHLVDEAYFNGDTAETLHDIRSATKSITAALMGIALQQGAVHTVDDSIATYLPGLPHDGKQQITIRDLLNMRSGLDANDEYPSTPGDEDNLDRSTDWIRTAYQIPLKTKPGTQYLYCSLNAFLTGAIIENATHISLDQFAKKYLFEPIGIRSFEWRHVPIDRTTGQGNLQITARNAAAIGELFLNGGRVEGKQIVPAEWVKQSLASQVPISFSDSYADYYGYMWYTKSETVGNHMVLVHFASGNGGNKIYLVPSLNMVVAITSSAYSTNYGQRRSQDILLKILAAAHP
jgi:CubicO group peptidase (beta-lactamase class C family)